MSHLIIICDFCGQGLEPYATGFRRVVVSSWFNATFLPRRHDGTTSVKNGCGRAKVISCQAGDRVLALLGHREDSAAAEQNAGSPPSNMV